MKCEKDSPIFPISVVSKLIGVSPKMIRTYEQEHLILPSRTPDKEKIRGRRLYSQEDVEYLLSLRELMRFGYTIDALNMLYAYIQKEKNKGFKDNKQEFLLDFENFCSQYRDDKTLKVNN